jgi:hypothetical protein
MNHLSCSPDLAPSDFYLFEPMKMHLGHKFQTDDILKHIGDSGMYILLVKKLSASQPRTTCVYDHFEISETETMS